MNADTSDFGIDLLVIAAHPDDVEFGIGGSVARWTAEGRRVACVICTSGEKGTSDRTVNPEDLARLREDEQRAAANTLGVSEVVFLRRPDQGLEDTAEFRKQIVTQIRHFKPRRVATSDPYRRYIWHRDHRIIGQVVLDAVFPYARDHLSYPDLLEAGYEPHKVREIWFWGADEVNRQVDITATFPQKVAALQCHASQIKALPVADLAAFLEKRCRQVARDQSYDLGEAFYRVVAPD